MNFSHIPKFEILGVTATAAVSPSWIGVAPGPWVYRLGSPIIH
jgi:hypothetical protein